MKSSVARIAGEIFVEGVGKAMSSQFVIGCIVFALLQRGPGAGALLKPRVTAAGVGQRLASTHNREMPICGILKQLLLF
jgi:hypothetical protein